MKRRDEMGCEPTRRRLLKGMASGALFLSTARLTALLGQSSSGSGQAPKGSARIDELAELLRTSPREKVFDLAALRVRQGATHQEMLAGVLLAAVRDVRPWPPGVKFHVMLMAPSAMELARTSSLEDAWLGVFFNIKVLKEAQEADIAEGDWTLPAAPPPLTDDPDRARRTLSDALEARDLKTADTAATAAARLLDPADLFEILWPIGARDFTNIGHVMIHTAQAHRALRMVDGSHREPVIRSLVYALVSGSAGRPTAPFERNRQRIKEMPDGWEAGRPDPEVSREILLKLRAATAEEAVDHTLALLRRGVAAESMWDGWRLAASEFLSRLAGSSIPNAQLLGVHPMTILNAFGYASRTSRREETRRLLFLQAAAWLALARDVLKDLKGLSTSGPGIERLEAASEPCTVQQAIEAASRSDGRSASMVLRVAREPELASQFISQCRSLTLRKAPEHHHHKYAAAVFEDFPGTHPRWGPHLLAVSLSYLRNPADPDSDVTQLARAALSKAASSGA